MSGINVVLEGDWAKARVIGPNSGSLLSQSTYVSMIVTEIKGEENGEEAGEKTRKGRGKQTVKQPYQVDTACIQLLRSRGPKKQAKQDALSYFASLPSLHVPPLPHIPTPQHNGSQGWMTMKSSANRGLGLPPLGSWGHSSTFGNWFWWVTNKRAGRSHPPSYPRG